MKIYNRYVAVLLLFLAITNQAFAAQQLKMQCDKSHTSEHYYVPAGGVYVSPSGIFISLDGKMFEVSLLCADETGVFVPEEEMRRQFVWCPICQSWYDPDSPHSCK